MEGQALSSARCTVSFVMAFGLMGDALAETASLVPAEGIGLLSKGQQVVL